MLGKNAPNCRRFIAQKCTTELHARREDPFQNFTRSISRFNFIFYVFNCKKTDF